MGTAKNEDEETETDLTDDDHEQVKKPAKKKSSTTKKKDAKPTKEPEKPSLTPVIFMVIMFIVAIVLALVLAPIYYEMGLGDSFEALGGQQSLWIPLLYIVIIIVFTAIILFVTRKRKGRFIKYAFLGVICLSLMYVFFAVFNHIFFPPIVQDWSAEIEVEGGVNAILIADILGDWNDEVIIGTSSGNIEIYDQNLKKLWTTPQPVNGPIADLAVANINNDSKNELIALAGNVYIFESSGQNNTFNLVWTSANDYYTSLSVVPNYPIMNESDSNTVLIVGSSTSMGNYNGTVENIYFSNNTYNSNTILSLDFPIYSLEYGAFEDPSNAEIFIGTNNGIYTIGSPKSASTFPSVQIVVPNDAPIVGIKVINIDNKGNSELIAWDTSGTLFIYETNNSEPIWKKDLGNSIGGVMFDDFFSDNSEYQEDDGREISKGNEMIVSVNGKLLVYYSIENEIYNGKFEITKEIGHLDSSSFGLASGYLDDNNKLDIVVGHNEGFNQYQYDFTPPIYSDTPCFMGLIVAILITVALFYYPEWYLVDIVGILVAGGVAALIGISIGLLPIIVLLIVLAIYDAISVYKTKHMVSLADKVMEFKLPILLVVPKKRGYSFLRQKGLKKQLDEGEEREAMFIGLGDIIIPGTLVVSAFHFLPVTDGWFGISANLLVAIFTLVGTLVGFSALMHYVLKGNPQAGLPLLNTGAILGFFISNFVIYQDLTFGLTLPFG